ncbi:hypothetical protein J6590_021395 [Homalodisca vitripennis]|nr:hypothetical protein J6590_021395 [Homalodisca vitripennis]
MNSSIHNTDRRLVHPTVTSALVVIYATYLSTMTASESMRLNLTENTALCEHQLPRHMILHDEMTILYITILCLRTYVPPESPNLDYISSLDVILNMTKNTALGEHQVPRHMIVHDETIML